MANPSDVPASSAGTEILRRAHGNPTSSSGLVVLNGVANYTYTILSVIVCETAGAAETFNMILGADGQTTNVFIIKAQSLPANGTFVFDNKFVMSETDELVFSLGDSGNVDVLVSYIENRWA